MKRLIAILALLLCAGMASAQAPAGFTKLSNVSVLTYTDSTCPDLTTCEYVVTTVDSAGVESAGAACATGQLCVNGNILVVVMPSSGTHTVLLTWLASPTANVTYSIYSHIGPLPGSGAKATVQ